MAEADFPSPRNSRRPRGRRLIRTGLAETREDAQLPAVHKAKHHFWLKCGELKWLQARLDPGSSVMPPGPLSDPLLRAACFSQRRPCVWPLQASCCCQGAGTQRETGPLSAHAHIRPLERTLNLFYLRGPQTHTEGQIHRKSARRACFPNAHSSQELGTPPRCLTWLAGTPLLRPSLPPPRGCIGGKLGSGAEPGPSPGSPIWDVTIPGDI